jgi:hypothetical protein
LIGAQWIETGKTTEARRAGRFDRGAEAFDIDSAVASETPASSYVFLLPLKRARV